mmetsp:Transcript_52358/g.128501  ORF Transcript_52358/g.128501 Transcript_52358/m.128501 type:complete len:222 (-) Transcript_52358:140-805(-)
MARSSLIFGTTPSMKDWPPKPGLTVMMRMRSTMSKTYSMAESGVAGLSTTPALHPSSLIMLTVRCRWMVDSPSQCTEIMSAPALTKSGMRSSGSTIIRWTSSGLSVTGRSASTTSGPIVMLGTNRPSMTSTCTQSQPALSMARTSSPSLEKSADRMDGDTTQSPALGMATSAALITVRRPHTLAPRAARTAPNPPAFTKAIAPRSTTKKKQKINLPTTSER